MDEIRDTINQVMEGYKAELIEMLEANMLAVLDELFLTPLVIDGEDTISDDFISGFCAALYHSEKINPLQAERLEKIIKSARALILLDL